MALKAKFRSTCKQCQRSIVPGQDIIRYNGRYAHIECVPEGEDDFSTERKDAPGTPPGDADADGPGRGESEGSEGEGSEGEGSEGEGSEGEGSEGEGDNESGDMENPYTDENGRRFKIAQALIENDNSRTRAYDQLVPEVNAQREPFVYRSGKPKRPMPLAGQRNRVNYEIGIVQKQLAEQSKGEPKGEQKGEQKSDGESRKDTDPAGMWLDVVRKIRKFTEDHDDFDTIGYRPLKDGLRMLAVGIPMEACLDALMFHWPAETKRQARQVVGMNEFKFTKQYTQRQHLMKLAEAKVLICLIGPAGVGKGYAAKQLAKDLNLPYGRCPLTAGATPAWLAGRHTMEGFIEARFVKLYGGGGVFLFDEMDAADPNMLLLTNEALANGEFDNPISGEIVERSQDFIGVAAMNTPGTGANRKYTGRERLDFSTLDRWRMGRMFMGIESGVEDDIVTNGGRDF